jgi:hypothetical protein
MGAIVKGAAAVVVGAVVLPAVLHHPLGHGHRHAHHGVLTSLLGSGQHFAPTVAGNLALGKRLAAERGWTGHQWSCQVWLWNRESGWSQYADTRVTHAGGDGPGSVVFAYGVAQARPASKYPPAGRPPSQGGRSDPEAQERWGLSYEANRYGSPCGAWAHEEAKGWY